MVNLIFFPGPLQLEEVSIVINFISLSLLGVSLTQWGWDKIANILHKIQQILTDLLRKTGKLCSGSSTLNDRTDRAQFPYFLGPIRTPVFCM